MTNVVHRDFTDRKPLPAPNSDFYQLVEELNPDELALVKKVRAYMETKVAPIINKYWSDDQFPFELLPSFKELNIGGLGYDGYGCAGGSQKQFGFVHNARTADPDRLHRKRPAGAADLFCPRPVRQRQCRREPEQHPEARVPRQPRQLNAAHSGKVLEKVHVRSPAGGQAPPDRLSNIAAGPSPSPQG
jgi:hypothetical protein